MKVEVMLTSIDFKILSSCIVVELGIRNSQDYDTSFERPYKIRIHLSAPSVISITIGMSVVSSVSVTKSIVSTVVSVSIRVTVISVIPSLRISLGLSLGFGLSLAPFSASDSMDNASRVGIITVWISTMYGINRARSGIISMGIGIGISIISVSVGVRITVI